MLRQGLIEVLQSINFYNKFNRDKDNSFYYRDNRKFLDIIVCYTEQDLKGRGTCKF